MQDYKIEVQKRELSSKKSFVKDLRHNGDIPGIYYSHDSKESIPFMVTQKVLREALKSDSQVYKINVGSKTRDVIIKSIQYHPITEKMIHIDLYGVDMDTKVVVKVPIVIIGQSVGVKDEGGVLNQSMTEVEIECLPQDIPQNIEADISDLAIGDTLRLDNINLADNLALVGDLDMLIASVVAPAKQEEEIIEAEDEGAELTDDTAADSESSSEENSEGASE
ncbi:50S ribosomal protein L25 [bacterium]|nr:50S ribosomal protein L25 [bacterium]